MRLRTLRKQKGITMKELGEIVGVSESAISQYETGKRNADYETLLKFAEYFDCSLDYLLGRTNDVSPSEIVIPNELKGVKVAFHRGEFEDLTQYEVDRLAEFAKFLKTQRKEDKPDDEA